jgi:hypothetical protein
MGSMEDHSEWLKAVKTTSTVVDTLVVVVQIRTIVPYGRFDLASPKG